MPPFQGELARCRATCLKSCSSKWHVPALRLGGPTPRQFSQHREERCRAGEEATPEPGPGGGGLGWNIKSRASEGRASLCGKGQLGAERTRARFLRQRGCVRKARAQFCACAVN